MDLLGLIEITDNISSSAFIPSPSLTLLDKNVFRGALALISEKL
jgi:hypothetical protein